MSSIKYDNYYPSCTNHYLFSLIFVSFISFSFNRGATGHSQGIVPALIFASSKTESELINNIYKAIKMLFWSGVRMQQCTTFSSTTTTTTSTTTPDKNNILKDIINSQHPTPMMAVFHLLPQTVQQYIDVVNRSAELSKAPERQIELALKNSNRAVIVVGHPGNK